MKRQLMTLVCLLVSIVLTAATLTKDEARQMALLFLNERGANVAAARGMQQVKLQLKDGVVTDQLYVFNVGQKEGFVIVSGDDCTGDVVLGYADKGEIAAENMPVNLKAWLQSYADQIQWMQKHGVTNDVAASRAMKTVATRKPVNPQMTCLWNQDSPYNDYCPVVSDPLAGYVNAATGCVATAVAQVLYFHGKKTGPITTLKPTVEYVSNQAPLYEWANAEHTSLNSISATIPAKPVRTFDWSKMADIYPSTDEANEEVARLMEFIGAGLEMQYGPSSFAFSQDIPAFLVDYFGYDVNMRCVSRNDYEYAEWLQTIYDELTTNGPVLFGGASTGGGHQFVIDGFDQEDYFYVNWGWGGYSNGFFKLSVLYSETQGIGGSSSQDGYNYQQDAIIGVKPTLGVVENTIRMSLTEVAVDQTTYSRSSSEDNFSGVVLKSSMYNWTGSVNTFDLGWALYDGNEYAILGTPMNNVDLALNSGFSIEMCPFTVSFGAGLSDGVYRLVPVSRKHGTSTWLPDYKNERYYIKATISGTTLTLERMGIVSLNGTLAFSGNTAGEPVTVTATVTNNGSLYSGDLLLATQFNDDTETGKIVAAQQVEIASGATKDIIFTFVPEEAGKYDVELVDKSDNSVAEGVLNVYAAIPVEATTGTLKFVRDDDLTWNVDWHESTYGCYGTKVSGTVKISNTSTTTAHTSGIIVKLFGPVDEYGYAYPTGAVQSFATNIAAESFQNFDFELDGMEEGNRYFVNFYYADGTKIGSSYAFTSIKGVTFYKADGTKVVNEPAATVVAPDDVVTVDCEGLASVTAITPNSNPNTLYIVGSSVPAGLEGKNVVKDGVAETLALTDGYAFFSPVDFTATKATYTRTFTTGANGTDGWSTIVLPFDVDAVKQGSNVIDWFHSGSDTGKNFWLKNFSSEDGNTVYFDYADKLEANTPYIIAVPSDKWGAAWDLTGKAITFEGSSVNVTTGANIISGNNYKLVGTLTPESVTDCYVLNGAGNAFAKTTATVDPFRAYFKSIKMLVGAVSQLNIGSENGGVTGVNGAALMNKETKNNEVYNLAGQRVANPTKGLYIKSGKKVIIK
ncbi:MAG: C10 family peptidase [Prevotella sp.]|nr:C10 family peptidase [Prevotella sp.]